MAAMANFSRLIIDPSLPLISNDLIPATYRSDPSLPVSFNANGYQFYNRLSGFWLEYHKVLQEMMWFLEP
jgi:predicted N-formylglutamate amidohydrolase